MLQSGSSTLEGKMTATMEGDAFKRLAQPILDAIGPYPHAELHAMRRLPPPEKSSALSGDRENDK
jgi:hypothetical protein